jgi:hypothetical protein
MKLHRALGPTLVASLLACTSATTPPPSPEPAPEPAPVVVEAPPETNPEPGQPDETTPVAAPPTTTQIAALAEGGDSEAAATVESWGRQTEYFLREDFPILDWETAKAELMAATGPVAGKQYHTTWVVLRFEDDRRVLVGQPKIDALIRLVEDQGLDWVHIASE